MLSQFGPLFNRLGRYFHAYGGVRGVVLSPFFILALAITGTSYNKWLSEEWIATAQSLLPNLLGFSLGTYSILFSLLTGRIRRAMRAMINENGVSRLEELNASFFHFIFVQVIALTWAFVYSGTALTDLLPLIPCLDADLTLAILRIGGSFVGYVLLVYSFLLIVGASMAVYRLAMINDPQAE